MGKRKKGRKTIPMSRRTGPKTKSGKACRHGVVKSGRRAGNCLMSARSKK
ncbi:unnamed protein product [marine sediment metagenome]|uniref:Uncharacterized protein n=1 Tax=marine sediment metagenome TaxID=412755 RepID=X1DTH8_9ZZZZ